MYAVGIVVGDRRGLAPEEDAAPRRDAAVRDGAAQLQDAVAADRASIAWSSAAGRFWPGRHGDLRRHDRHLGAGILSAAATSESPTRHRRPASRACKRRRRARRIRRSGESRLTSTASLHQRYSFLGRAGQWIEPVVRPLGWDWRIGCAAIASFPGPRGGDGRPGCDLPAGPRSRRRRRRRSEPIAATSCGRPAGTTRAQPVYNLPVALSIMVFFALCAQCAATLAVIRRETNSWRWPVFTFAYMTVLAYVGALITYQIGDPHHLTPT